MVYCLRNHLILNALKAQIQLYLNSASWITYIEIHSYYKPLLFERSSPGGLGGTPMKRQLLEIQLDYIYKSLLFERSSPGGLGGTPMKRQLLEIQLDYIYKPLLFERSSPGGLGGPPMKRQLLEIQRVKKLTLTPVYILYAVPSYGRFERRVKHVMHI